MTVLRILRSALSLLIAASLACTGAFAWMLLRTDAAEAAGAGLTIYVGYAGGPYFEKAHFTETQLQSMSDGVTYEYSATDSGGFLRKGFARGVHLSTLLNEAGVQPEAMFRFYLGTSDGYINNDDAYGTNGDAWYYSSLVGQPRYYYSALYDYAKFIGDAFEGIYSEGQDVVLQSSSVVPSILALQSSFERVNGSSRDKWDYQPISNSSGYRLMFGQTNPSDVTAHDSAMNVRAITCIIGGHDGTDIPKIDIGNLIEVLKKTTAGQSVTFMPGLVNVQDPLVAQLGAKDIVVTSDNPDVLEATQNADGSWTLAVKEKGKANLAFSYGDSKNPDFVAKADASADVGGGSGNGDGADEGDGSGKGDGDADGAGQGADGDGSDRSQSGEDEGNIVLNAGTPLTPASIKPVQMDQSGSAGGSDEQGKSPQAQAQIYELEFDDETPLAESPEGESNSVLLVGSLGALCLFGGCRRAVSFQIAKDN